MDGQVSGAPKKRRLPGAVDFLKVRRRWLVEAARVPCRVFEELGILRRHRSILGVIDKNAISPRLQQRRLALTHADGIGAVGRLTLDFRATLALPLPARDDDWAAVCDDVAGDGVRSSVDDGAESALLRCLPLHVSDFRTRQHLLGRAPRAKRHPGSLQPYLTRRGPYDRGYVANYTSVITHLATPDGRPRSRNPTGGLPWPSPQRPSDCLRG